MNPSYDKKITGGIDEKNSLDSFCIIRGYLLRSA
jgi:hypothetical protein